MNALTTDRLLSEQLFHNRQAEQRRTRFSQPETLRFDDSEYLDHAPWIRPAMDRLGELKGRAVLDYGCGHGMAGVVLSRRGGIVTGIDLSEGYLQEAAARAQANQVDIRFRQADGEDLPFADETFNAVWGSAILHHLDLEKAGLELHRVLKPRGVAVFCEPWGGNPLLNWARRSLPYPGKERTPDEAPLTMDRLVPLRGIFSQVKVEGYELLGMMRRAFLRQPGSGGALARLDQRLMRRFPHLQNWGRYVVITLRRC